MGEFEGSICSRRRPRPDHFKAVVQASSRPNRVQYTDWKKMKLEMGKLVSSNEFKQELY